jgi:hypothetical protein
MNFSLKAGALAVAMFAGAAHSSVLFENGVNNSFYSGNNPFTYMMVTDDFVLGQAATVNNLTYNAFTTLDTLPVTNVQVSIFANNAGAVGGLLYQGDFGVASQQVTGTDWSYDYTDYTVNVGSWNLAAGSYFLGLQVSPEQWDQHWSIPHQTFGKTGSDGFDHYFRLEGTVAAVPEPESYALLLAGLGLMGAVVRRQKQKVTAA